MDVHPPTPPSLRSARSLDGSLHTLWHSDALQRARRELAARDRDIVEAQIAVSEIAAPTGDERARGTWMADRFRALGLHSVRTDDAGNVIGRREGRRDEAPVVICAHLDTVFPHGVAVRVQRDGSRICGPGIGDNGRGLAVMLALAAIIDGRTLRTRAPIDFVATTGEEGTGDLRGAKELFANAARDARAAIALDGAGDERIVHRALGSRRYRIGFQGVGGHSWTAYGIPNPVHAAAIVGAKLARLSVPGEPRTTLSIGRIGGGISVNSIPDTGWLEVDLRSTSSTMLDRYDREIRAAARAAEQEENARRARGTLQLQCQVSLIGDRPSGETPPDHPLVKLAMEATRLIGRVPELATASTDANVPISRGIPAIAIGAGGRGGDAHTSAEWFDNTDGQLGVARALAIIVSGAGLSA
jgi:acetylornithine deacetylase/succinyl-diaminopimelate desuccinylase-like protein